MRIFAANITISKPFNQIILTFYETHVILPRTRKEVAVPLIRASSKKTGTLTHKHYKTKFCLMIALW